VNSIPEAANAPYWAYWVPALIGAIQVITLAWINRKVNSTNTKVINEVSQAKDSAAETAASVEKVHVAVNSERTAMLIEVKTLRDEILDLSKRIAKDEQRVEDENLQAKRAPAKILFVDDEKNCYVQFAQVARKKGCELTWARNRDEAIRALGGTGASYDAAIVDEKLPGASGHEIIIEIRALFPTLITVLSSGYKFADIDIVKQLGPTIFMPKPILISDIETLLNTIEQWRYWRGLSAATPPQT